MRTLYKLFELLSLTGTIQLIYALKSQFTYQKNTLYITEARLKINIITCQAVIIRLEGEIRPKSPLPINIYALTNGKKDEATKSSQK